MPGTQEALSKGFVLLKMIPGFSCSEACPSESQMPWELGWGHCLWVGAPPPLCRPYPCVAYRNDFFQMASSSCNPSPHRPTPPEPQKWSALRTAVKLSGDWGVCSLGEERAASVAPRQVQLLPQLSKPGSLGARGGAPSTFSRAASEYFEFH